MGWGGKAAKAVKILAAERNKNRFPRLAAVNTSTAKILRSS